MNSDPADQNSTREIERDALEVLIDLDLEEAAEREGTGWKVTVVEHLRLRVPTDTKEAWMRAELQTWDPWLRAQRGFMGREVLWDQQRQEGILLIHWSSRQDWMAIPETVVASIQSQFEAEAKRILSLHPQSENPFPLVYAGETPHL